MDRQIESMQRQRKATQMKVFTKWINSHLAPVNLEVNDLVEDMSDGIRLVRLIEIITGDSLGKLNPGKQRFQKIDNINKCLIFLSKRFPVKGISAEDIAGGNIKAMLSLLWLIFLNLQMGSNTNSTSASSYPIQMITDDSQNKESLLKWCQTQTSNRYPGVTIEDFTYSWQNGLGFNALVHRFRPDLIKFDALDPLDAATNLSKAFQIAEENLGIPKILEVEDVLKEKPDENSILIYIAYLYQAFYSPAFNKNGTNKVENIVEQKMVSKVTAPLQAVPTSPPPKLPSCPPPKVMPRLHSQSSNDDSKKSAKIATANTELIIYPDSWECNYCTFMNTPITQVCAICFNKKSADCVLAKDKNIVLSKPPTPIDASEIQNVSIDSDEPEWSEEDEILKRPPKEPPVNAQRISITLASPEDLQSVLSPLPLVPDQKEEQEQKNVKPERLVFSHPDDWKCDKCGFCNPHITKICGSCFVRRSVV